MLQPVFCGDGDAEDCQEAFVSASQSVARNVSCKCIYEIFDGEVESKS